jgi:hypothetical protein
MVTVTIKKQDAQATYLVYAVTGNLDISKHEVHAYSISATDTQLKVVKGLLQNTPANGTLTFYNSAKNCGCAIVIPGGTVFIGTSGIAVITDADAAVASLCKVTVPAHALVDYGLLGEIPAHYIHQTYKTTISVDNEAAFIGYGQYNAVVQQSDIDAAVSALKVIALQNAQHELSAKLGLDLHLFTSSDFQPCSTSYSTKPAVRDGTDSVNVSVIATCNGLSYDYKAATTLVTTLFEEQISAYFGTDITKTEESVGPEIASVEAVLLDQKSGTLILTFRTNTKFAFQFNASSNAKLARVIAGKNKDDVKSVLLRLRGVQSVDISSNSVFGWLDIFGIFKNTLPLQTDHITIKVKQEV